MFVTGVAYTRWRMKSIGDSSLRARIVAFLAILAVLAANTAAAQTARDRLRASVSLASDYILHGLAQTDGEPSLRLALDFESEGGFFVGGTLANVDYLFEDRFRKPRDSQIAVYGGHLWRRGQWTANVALSRYVYPGIEINYDYTQLAFTVAYRDRYFLTASRVSNYLSVSGDAYDYRAGMAWPWVENLELGVNAGRFSSSGRFGSSYTYWDAGLSRPAGRFTLDLRFHDSTYGRSSLLGNYVENLWVLSLSYVLLPTGSRR